MNAKIQNYVLCPEVASVQQEIRNDRINGNPETTVRLSLIIDVLTTSK